MVDYTFVVEKMCPVCLETTRITKTRSRLVVEKRDEDMCVHYKDFNPYYYKIWICEKCGYAADEKTFTSVLPKTYREKLWAFVQRNQLDIEFEEKRTLPDAVASYLLALLYLDLTKGAPSKKAIYNLNLAWLYRFADYPETEREYMLKAAEFYDESLTTERYPVEGLTDSGALYLIGAIYYRLGDIDRCTQYLSRIISDQNVRTNEPKVFDKARDLWTNIREMKKSAIRKSFSKNLR